MLVEFDSHVSNRKNFDDMSATTAPDLTLVDVRSHPIFVEKSLPQVGSRPPSISYIRGHLTLFYDPVSRIAFVKVRVLVHPKENVSVYLNLHPEQITNLAHDPTTDRAAELVRLLARGSVALRFTLKAPGTMVGPPEWPFPAGEIGQGILDDVQFLAAQTDLVIHVPLGIISNTQTRSLCLAFSQGSLIASVTHAGLGFLYGGRGGKVLQLVETPSVPPPVYDPPAGRSRARQESVEPSAPAKKRRRGSGGSQTAAPMPEVSEPPDAPQASPELQERVDLEASVAAMERSEHLRDQYRSYIQMLCGEVMDLREKKMEEAMDMREKKMEEAMAKREVDLRAEFHTQLKSSEARIMAGLEDMGLELEARLVDMIHQDYSEYATKVDLEDVIDDRVAGIKIEMEEFVKDEMRSAHEIVADYFS